jgi:spoIIIJ-associated protein
MKVKRATLEAIAPSVEEAIEKGLAELGLPAEAVEVEILDQGSRGLFGLGSRQARIRLTVLSATEEGVKDAPSKPKATPPVEPQPAATAEPISSGQAAPPSQRSAPVKVKNAISPEQENDMQIAQATVSELLDTMKVRATVTVHYAEADDERSRVPIMVDIHGDDLSILIGRRAETLNALQYISSLIVSKELGRPVSLVIDVEGYRARREGQLRQLARRMAEQAVKTGRRQVLEPMPANERRIIHLELRENEDVVTESIGEEPRRKVTILPKE